MSTADEEELFPACAGVILYVGSLKPIDDTFPRACGGDPVAVKSP